MKLQSAEAGVNDGKAGLLSSAGLFHKAGIFDKKSESFNIQNLNPYLLFDAQSSMRGTLEAPTLDLDPATPSSLDVITAVRAGVATYTDASGVIQSAIANTVRVDQTQGAELTPTKFQNIGYTDFSQAWSTYGGTTELGDGYDGQPSLVSTMTLSGQSYEYFDSVAGVTYTGSFWARAVSGSGPFRFAHGNSATGPSVVINLTSEWQFFSTQFLGRSGGGAIYFGIGATSGGDSVEIAMPQVEEGTTASSFVANTTGSPKFITGATYGPRVPMILVEPSATNLVTYSEDFSNSFYIKDSGVSIGTTTHLSPSGNADATKIEVSDNGRIYANATSDTYHTTILIKSGTFSHFKIGLGSVDLLAGTNTNGTIETFSNGWHRIGYSYTGNRPLQIQAYPDATYSVHSDSGNFYIWGAQVETGSVATSYIPTSGSTVTRAADDLVISGSAFSDFYNTYEGTFYAESVPRSLINGRYLTVSDGTSYNRVKLYEGSSLSRFFVAKDDATQTYLANTASSINTLNRIAASYKLNNFLTSANGTQFELPDTGGTPPTSVNRMNVGSNETGVLQLNGHIKRLIYWPTHSDSL
jgi:hypothetical protein